MSDLGCPYIAGPACRDCDGSCWTPTQQGPPQPEPCQGCSIITDHLTDCEGWCAGVANEEDLNAAIETYRNPTEEAPDARA